MKSYMIEKYKTQCLNAKKSKRLKSKKVIFAMFKKVIALSCISGVVVISNIPLLDAYEAHIINVTAEIRKLEDPVFDPLSMGFCVMEEGVDVTSTDPNDGPVVVHYEVGAGTLDPDLVLDPDCDSPAGTGDPSTAHLDITQQDTVIKVVTCTADGLHQGRVVYEAYHFDPNLCPVVCGDCEGKVSILTLKYNGSQASLIKVVQKKDGGVVFENIVEPNGQFSFAGTVNGTLSTEITIYINDVENTKIHTSCSELIGPNMSFGDFTIIAGESSGGGALCPVLGDIVLNEFLPNPDCEDNALMPDGEWVELYNNDSFNIDVAGWYLYDNNDSQSLKIALSNSDNNSNILDTGETVVPAHGWLVVYVNGKYDDWLNNTGGDSVRLYNNEISTGMLIDSHTYISNALSGKSYARIPDGTGAWVDSIPTPGTPNKVEDLANSGIESIGTVDIASSVPVDSPVEPVPEADDANSENLNDGLDSEAKNEGLSDTADDNEDPADDDSDDTQEDDGVIAKDEEAVDTVSDDEVDDGGNNPDELEAETALGAENVDSDVDDRDDNNNLEEDDLDNEAKNEDLPDTADSNEVPVDDDSDDNEVIAKDEESVDTASEDEVADDNDNNPDELELEVIGADDIAATDIEGESDAIILKETEESAEEEDENIIDDDTTISDISESSIDSNDNDGPQTEDNGTVDNDGGGELPITPDEGAVIDFNLNL